MSRNFMFQAISSSHVDNLGCLLNSWCRSRDHASRTYVLWISQFVPRQDTADPQALQGAPEEGIYIHGLFMDTWQLRCHRFYILYPWHPWHPFAEWSFEVKRWNPNFDEVTQSLHGWITPNFHGQKIGVRHGKQHCLYNKTWRCLGFWF